MSKPNALLYFRRNNLIVAGKKITPAKLALTEEHIKNLEIQDQGKFTATVREFLEGHGIKGKKVLIVLDQSVVFTKKIKLDEATIGVEPDTIIGEYVAQMPFAPGQRACVALEQDGNLQLFAVNAGLYQTLADTLTQSGASKLVAVTPAAAYQLNIRSRSATAAEQFLADKSVRKTTDFSTTATS
jgi:hypothetical protein